MTEWRKYLKESEGDYEEPPAHTHGPSGWRPGKPISPAELPPAEVVGGGEYRTSPGMPDIKDYKRGQSQEEIDTERSRWINSYTSGAHRDVWLQRIKNQIGSGKIKTSDAAEDYYANHVLPRVIDIVRNTPIKLMDPTRTTQRNPHYRQQEDPASMEPWKRRRRARDWYKPSGEPGKRTPGSVFLSTTSEEGERPGAVFTHEIGHAIDHELRQDYPQEDALDPELELVKRIFLPDASAIRPTHVMSKRQLKQIRDVFPATGKPWHEPRSDIPGGPGRGSEHSYAPEEIYTNILGSRLDAGRLLRAEDIKIIRDGTWEEIEKAGFRKETVWDLKNALIRKYIRDHDRHPREHQRRGIKTFDYDQGVADKLNTIADTGLRSMKGMKA